MYPPERIALLAFKDEKRLELWVRDAGCWVFEKGYPIRAASGGPGPKLREGDRQVPEGIYRIVRLNPNSRYHLSVKLDYPNSFDLEHAGLEGRSEPGSDIFIHGGASSVGCLAMGDAAIEELFELIASVGMKNVEVIIAPRDFRRHPVVLDSSEPVWLAELYGYIAEALKRFPAAS